MSTYYLRSRGFTLLELLLASLVMALVIGLVVQVARGGFLRMGTFSEAHESNDRALNLTARMSADMEASGHNMTLVSSAGAGTETPAFAPADGFTTSSGMLTRTAANGWTTYVPMTRGLGAGTGSFTFTPPANGTAAFITGADAKTFGMIIGFGGWLAVYENYVEVASTCCRAPQETLAPHVANDSYKFSVEIGSAQSPANVIRLFRIRSGHSTVLWTSRQPVPAYPLQLLATLYYQNDAIRNASVSGAPLVDTVLQPAPVAPLPMSADGQPERPLFLHYNPSTRQPDGLLALRGDVTTDPLRLVTNFDARGLAGEGVVTTSVPVRSTLATGDHLLLIDYAGRHSLMLQYLAPQSEAPGTGGMNTQAHLVLPLTENFREMGWNGLFWSESAASSFDYPAGSVLIKLADPIEYRWDGRETLLRREGDQAWTVAATGVTNFTVTEVAAPDSYSVRVTAELLPDTAFTSDDRTGPAPEIFEATFAPRALNSTYRR